MVPVVKIYTEWSEILQEYSSSKWVVSNVQTIYFASYSFVLVACNLILQWHVWKVGGIYMGFILFAYVFVIFWGFSSYPKIRRLAEALEIDDNSDPFNIRSSGPKYSDLLKEDARYVF